MGVDRGIPMRGDLDFPLFHFPGNRSIQFSLDLFGGHRISEERIERVCSHLIRVARKGFGLRLRQRKVKVQVGAWLESDRRGRHVAPLSESSTGERLPQAGAGIRVAAIRSPSPQLNKTAETAHCPVLPEALHISAVWFTASITMNWNITFRIPVLTVIAAALASLSGAEIGLDLVSCSPGPISGRGEIFLL
jgi:hypothetical protein